MNKILLIIPDDKLGGSELFLKNIVLFHLKLGDKVFVIFLKKSLSCDWDDIKLVENCTIKYNKVSNNLFGMIVSVFLILTSGRFFYRIYTSHLHTTSLAGFLIKLKLIKKVTFIGRESTSYFLRYSRKKLQKFKILYHLGYSSLDLLICQSDEMKFQLIKGLPKLISKINVQVINNPIDLKDSYHLQNSSSYDFPIKYKFIVSAGRLIWEKGFDILIAAFYKLKNEYPNMKLIILGEGALRKNLEDQISSLELDTEVFLPGHVSNVYDYFKNAEMCVVSSKIEGFPNVLLQMMSQNNRVVSTKCAGGIIDLKGIFCAETNNIEDLYLNMKKSLRTNYSNSLIFQNQLSERNWDEFFQKLDTYITN